MERLEYQSKRDEVLRRFSPAFKEKYNLDPTAHAIVEVLIRDGNIYDLIEQMVDHRIENNKRIFEHFSK